MIAENEGDDDDDRILRGLGKEWNGASLPVVPWGNKLLFLFSLLHKDETD